MPQDCGKCFIDREMPDNLPESKMRQQHPPYSFSSGHDNCGQTVYYVLPQSYDAHPTYSQEDRSPPALYPQTLCTHLHDNHGRDKNDPWLDADYHLLPFDGSYDFKDMMDRMNKYGYEGALTLEVNKKAPYAEMSNEDWLAMCYERLKKISEM